MERLFLAVQLDEPTRTALAGHLQSAGAAPLPGRPVPPANWHLTLRFLGGTSPEQRTRLERAMAAEALGPTFRVRLGALGAFPRAERATVLWIGAEDDGGLARLAGAAERAARAAGFPAEERPFRAHLTLARLRGPGDVAPLLQHTPAAGIEMPVQSLVLLRNQAGAGPPTYQAVARWPLQ